MSRYFILKHQQQPHFIGSPYITRDGFVNWTLNPHQAACFKADEIIKASFDLEKLGVTPRLLVEIETGSPADREARDNWYKFVKDNPTAEHTFLPHTQIYQNENKKYSFFCFVTTIKGKKTTEYRIKKGSFLECFNFLKNKYFQNHSSIMIFLDEDSENAPNIQLSFFQIDPRIKEQIQLADNKLTEWEQSPENFADFKFLQFGTLNYE